MNHNSWLHDLTQTSAHKTLTLAEVKDIHVERKMLLDAVEAQNPPKACQYKNYFTHNIIPQQNITTNL